MGKGSLKITPELLLENILLLEGYKLLEAQVIRYKEGVVHHEGEVCVLELIVEHDSIEVIERQPLPDILPCYRRKDYELHNIKIG